MSTKYQIRLTRDFVTQLHSLDPSIFAKWRHVGAILCSDPFHANLRHEKIEAGQDGVYSARLDDNYRILYCLIPPNFIVVYWVDLHDRAYDKAKRLSVDIKDGDVRIDEVTYRHMSTQEPPPQSQRRRGKLFDRWLDVELLQHGAPEEWLARLRSLDTSEEFWTLDGQLPSNAFEQLLELLHPALPASPFVSPPVSGSLIDRDEQQSLLSNFLLEGNTVTLGIHGQIGIGKSALAAWLYDTARDLGYITYWLSCTERRDFTVDTLLANLAQHAQPQYQSTMRSRQQSLNDRVLAAIEHLNLQPHLLVLDAFDALSDRHGLEFFIERVTSHPGPFRLVVTARVPLRNLVAGELSNNRARELALSALPPDAFRDFLIRVNPALKLTQPQAKTVLHKLAGNLSSVTKSMTRIQEYAWLDRLEELPPFSDDWLTSILSPTAVALAERLAILSMRFDTTTIERLCPTTAFAPSLMELIRADVMREVEAGLFLMDDELRKTLAARISPEARRAAFRAAGRYFAENAGQSTDYFRRSQNLADALDFFSRADAPYEVTALAQEAYQLMAQQGDWDRASAIAQKAVTAAQAVVDHGEQLKWLVRLAEQAIDREQLDVAQVHAGSALTILDQLEIDEARPENFGLRLSMCMTQGRLAYRTQRYPDAQKYYADGLELARQSQKEEIQADCLIRLGQTARRQSHYDMARILFEQALEISRRIQHLAFTFDCHAHLGLVARKQQLYKEAARHYQAAHQLAVETNNSRWLERAIGETGLLAADTGDFEAAEGFIRRSCDLARELRNYRGERIGLTRLIDVLIQRQRIDLAEPLLLESEQRNAESSDQIGCAWNLKHRGQLEQARGDIEAGNSLIRQGIQRLTDMGEFDYVPDFTAALILNSGKDNE